MFQPSLMLLYPEIWIGLMACVVLIADLYTKENPWVSYSLSQITIIVGFILLIKMIGEPSQEILNHSFVLDNVGLALKALILIFGFFVFLYARKYIFERHIPPGEYYSLSLFSILGMMILISAGSFLTLYLGLELLALPLYALIAIFREDEKAPEAAMKYFVMGALASGMLLFGISLLYGVTGSFQITKVASYLSSLHEMHVAVLLGMVLILAGLAFKLGAVPFHMWVPDVYQGSPTSVTLFIGTLPELAGFGMAIRILLASFPDLAAQWEPLFVVMAILSLAIGNIVAIAQTNLKRMLAYSAIGHIGFVFLGLLAGPDAGYSAAMVYVVIYTIMALGAFGIIIALSHEGFEAENIADFKGLGTEQPWVAFLMLIIMFSLAGIPPTAGFSAKFIVLDALINAGYTWLAALAVIFSVIGAFYYLRVIRVMFFDLPEIPRPRYQKVSSSGIALLSVNGLAVLFFGIYPVPIFNLCLNILGQYRL